MADVSVGDAWLPEYGNDGWGNSVAIARSRVADALVQTGIESGALHAVERSVSLILRSQLGGLDHKQKGDAFRGMLAAQAPNVPIPYVRPRVFTHLSPANMMVQVLRERVRAKSHHYWNDTREAQPFVRRMAASRRLLLSVTKLRKKHDAQISQLAREALKNPDALAEIEFSAIRIMLRWVRRLMRRGAVTRDELEDLFARRSAHPWPRSSD